MQRRTVVLVESDPSMEEMVQAIVQELDDADVVVSDEVQQAGAMIRDLSPALLIVDEDAPENAGLQLVQILNADAETRNLPVVVLCSDGDRGRYLVSNGAEAFLPKPFDVDDLLALIQFYVQTVPIRLAQS